MCFEGLHESLRASAVAGRPLWPRQPTGNRPGRDATRPRHAVGRIRARRVRARPRHNLHPRGAGRARRATNGRAALGCYRRCRPRAAGLRDARRNTGARSGGELFVAMAA